MYELETPPHAWGRQLFFACCCWRNRNTPTCVGKTRSRAAVYTGTGKHPHMRGEDPRVDGGKPYSGETPPHAWGRLLTQLRDHGKRRNTPTCVGKTRCISRVQPHRKKHPHMRGEDLMSTKRTSAAKETPPHAWGRPSGGMMIQLWIRNTPTCVGKTLNDH